MSDQEQLMNLLKKEMRSLLTAAKEGLTPFQLEQEYKSLMGKQLPFRALGYCSVLELVKDMPDVVNICRTRNGSLLKAIADERTKGIASLVARQKSKRKPYFSRRRLNFSLHSTHYHSRLPWRPQISLGLHRKGQLPHTLPAFIKSELKELLRHSPVLLSDFDKAFFQHFGRTFEFIRYGFFSISEVLNAASDIITIVQTKAGSLLTLKDDPPKKQREKLPRGRSFSNYGSAPLGSGILSQDEAVIQRDQIKQTLSTTVLSPELNTTSLTPGLSMNNRSETPKEKSDSSLPRLKMETQLVKTEERMKQLQKEMKIVLANKGPGGVVSSELKEKIKTIVAQYPEGLPVSKLPHEFEVHFQETLPVRKLGFLSLMELIGALSDVLHIEFKEGEQDCLIFDVVSQQLTDDEETNNETVQSGLLMHEDTCDEHRLPCWDFPFEDTKNLETKFNYRAIEEPCIMQEIVENKIPPDAAQDRNLYSLPELDSSALVGVFVEYAVSPSQFYIRIYSAETSDKLEDMMIEMRRCYSYKDVTDRYIIPEALIQPGQLCCAGNLKGKWWYRVIIHQIVDDQNVEVFYPDFGNMGIVQKSSLRLLKYCYAKLPAQAIPCSLAWVKPTEDDWTASAILEFQRLCRQKLLIGVVDEYIDGVLHLFLCDTSSDADIYFHTTLRSEGHALICRENIPSKGFKELNPSTLYLKPIPKQKADLTEAAVSLLQQECLDSLSGTTDSEFCNSEVVFQRFDTRENLVPEQLEKGYSCQETCLFEPFCESSRLEQNEGILEAEVLKEDKLCVDSEMTYLEPVHLCKEIWDESWIPSEYYEGEKNGDMGDNLCPDIAVFSYKTSNDQESKNKIQHSQHLILEQKEDISGAAEAITFPNLEPLKQILDASEETETTSSLGAASDSLPQTPEEFYISIAHSRKLGESSQIGVDVNNYTSQPFSSTSASCDTSGLTTKLREASLEKKTDETSRTQVVALCNPSSYRDHRAMDHNALVFTAELQGSPVFCVTYSRTVALGASARLATSGGCFPLSLRKVKI